MNCFYDPDLVALWEIWDWGRPDAGHVFVCQVCKVVMLDLYPHLGVLRWPNSLTPDSKTAGQI